jgi:hypothetical protein
MSEDEYRTVTRAARELVEALHRMNGRVYLSLNVRYWEAELNAALEREDELATAGTAA